MSPRSFTSESNTTLVPEASLRCLLLFLTCVLSTPAIAQTGDHTVVLQSGFLTGEKFKDMPEAQQEGYVMGLVDGAYFAPALGRGLEAGRSIARLKVCIGGKSNVQLAAMARKYLSDHPEGWDQPMNVLFLMKVIECPGMLAPPSR